jgi:hypothetical protein
MLVPGDRSGRMLKLFLLDRGSTTRTFSRTCIGLGALPSAGKSATMASPPVTSQVDQPFNIHGNFASPITFDNIVAFNDRPDPRNIIAAKIIAVHLIRQVSLIKNTAGGSYSYSVDIGERSIHVFVAWQIHTSYTCQDSAPCAESFSIKTGWRLSLSLFMLLVGATDPDDAFSLKNFALCANFFN